MRGTPPHLQQCGAAGESEGLADGGKGTFGGEEGSWPLLAWFSTSSFI